MDEAFYHELMARKLKAAGIAHQVKPRGRLIHRGIVADEFEADLIIAEALAAELKVLWTTFVPDHFLQVICYLKFWRLAAGLLFDFGKESLVQKRVPFLERVADFDPSALRFPVSSSEAQSVLSLLAESLRVILAEHGLGYRNTTYRGLLFAELTYRGVPCLRDPLATIRGDGDLLGEAKLDCLVLPGQCALLVTSLRDAHKAADRALLQTHLRHLDLPWGLHLNFGKTRIECQFVHKPKGFRI